MRRSWLICRNCGHVHNGFRLSTTQLNVLYQNFRDSAFREESPDEYFDRIVGLPEAESENFQKVSKIHSKLIAEGQTGSGIALDIGCGGGVLIDSLSKMLPDWDFYGVEPTPEFADLASRRTVAHVACGYYRGDHFSLGGRAFDLITCCAVLEHVVRPSNFLSVISRDLAPRGLLYLEVPDLSAFRYLPSDHDHFMVQHISFFSTESLLRVLEEQGFEVIENDVYTTKRGHRNLSVFAKISNP